MLIDTPVKEDEVKTHKKTSTAETQVFVYINHFAADRENLIIHFNVKKEIRVQKVNDYIIVYLLIGIAFVLLEVYFVKNKRMNKWILPSIILIASIALSILFSVTFGASLILFQVVVLMGLYIEDLINHNQNRESDKMKLKIYNSRNFIMANGLDDGVFLGPVIREENKKRIVDYIESGIREGAKLLLDRRERTSDEGYLIGPTIFEEVTMEMKIWKDEIFAPVLSIIKVKNLKEGIQIANQSEFANGACLFTDSASSVRYFRENIEAGMLGINIGVPAPMAVFPFSGWKPSFYGSFHANGKDAVDFYTRRKVVTARY